MKWLWRTVKFFALALLVTAFGLRVAGKRSGANHMQASLEIAKPPAEVWDWVSEPEKLNQLGELADRSASRRREPPRRRFHSRFARLMEPLITPSAQKKMNRDIARLKRLAEEVR